MHKYLRNLFINYYYSCSCYVFQKYIIYWLGLEYIQTMHKKSRISNSCKLIIYQCLLISYKIIICVSGKNSGYFLEEKLIFINLISKKFLIRFGVNQNSSRFF